MTDPTAQPPGEQHPADSDEYPAAKPPRASLRVRLLGCLVGCLMTLCGLGTMLVLVVLALGGSLEEFGQRRTGLNVMQDLYTSAPYSSWQLMPEATIQYARPPEFDVRVTINSQGFRADREYALEPPPGTFRIMTLGDSFVEALQVAVDETFSAVLEDCLNEEQSTTMSEVIDAGVSNYSAGDAMLHYEYLGRSFHPDLVILTFYVGNDFIDTLRQHDTLTFRYGGYTFALDDNGELTWTRIGPPEFLADLRQNLLNNRAIWRVVKRIGADVTPYDEAVPTWGQRPEDGMEPRLYLWDARYPDVPPAESMHLNDAWPITQAIIQRLRDLVVADGGQLAVLLLPPWDILRDGDWNWYQTQAELVGTTLERFGPQNLLTSWLAEVGIPVLDTTPAVIEALESDVAYYLLNDGHFSLEGQRSTGRLLCEFVQDEGLVP